MNTTDDSNAAQAAAKNDPALAAEWREAVRLELLGEAAKAAEVGSERAARLLDAMRAAQARVQMPRAAAEPTPLREWAVQRRSQFGPVKPDQEVLRFMRSEWIALALGGQLPTAEHVAQLAAAMRRVSTAESLIGSVALVAMPVDRDSSDTQAMRVMLRGEARPADLETLVSAALVLEFAAAHVQGTVPMARLLGTAATLWWGAGQRRKATVAVQLAVRYDATWPVLRVMQHLLVHRTTPAWLSS